MGPEGVLGVVLPEVPPEVDVPHDGVRVSGDLVPRLPGRPSVREEAVDGPEVIRTTCGIRLTATSDEYRDLSTVISISVGRQVRLQWGVSDDRKGLGPRVVETDYQRIVVVRVWEGKERKFLFLL